MRAEVVTTGQLAGSGRPMNGQTPMRGLVDVHVHYNGDKAFLKQMCFLDPVAAGGEVRAAAGERGHDAHVLL